MKGNYNEECNITACQKPSSAVWYNNFNHKYYCENCAERLNSDAFNKRDSLRLLGHEMMCTLQLPKPLILDVGTDRNLALEVARISQELKDVPLVFDTQEQSRQNIKGSGSIENSINELLNNTFNSELLVKNLDIVPSNFKSGRENRRERRKQQRK